VYLSGGLCFSEIGRFRRALRIARLLEMLWVYCFHESPANLFIVDRSPFASDSTACQTKRSSGAARAPELPSDELVIKRSQKHPTGMWKLLQDLVFLRRKVIYVLLRMKSTPHSICRLIGQWLFNANAVDLLQGQTLIPPVSYTEEQSCCGRFQAILLS